MRSAVNQAKSAVNTDNSTAAGYGSGAADISSTLTPFLTRELYNPQGYSQQDLTAMTSAAEGGAGGITGGIQTRENQRAAATGNGAGFGASADNLARTREQAAAHEGEAIAGQNANQKLNQQQEAASGLRGMYGTDVGAQMKALGLVPENIKAEADANSTGWFQNMTNLISSLGTAAKGFAAMKNG